MNYKITYCCYPSVFSRLIANLLVQKYNIPIENILYSTKILKLDKVPICGLKGYLYAFKRLGFRFICYEILLSTVAVFILKLLFKGKGYMFYSFDDLCSAHQIKLIKSDNFNSDKVINKIKHCDYLLSMCLDQILNDHFISSIKGLCINIHPSDLPDFRGVDSIFQFLLSKEEKMGISMHMMTAKIDCGKILIKRFTERKNKSHMNLMKNFVSIGIEMFSLLIKHSYNTNIDTIKNRKDIKYPYKSWPTKQEIKSFYKSNRLFKGGDFLRWNI